jgi:SAM-dependent methyltransferase
MCYGYYSDIPGLRFDRFGRVSGLRLLSTYPSLAKRLLVHPVDMIRYAEFAFAHAHVPRESGRCLDVSSPRLFALYTADQRPESDLLMINPDPSDLVETKAMASALALPNIDFHCKGVQVLGSEDSFANGFDCIWSLSVVEHIYGDCDDTEAMRLMYGALAPGGRLIITVPVDQRHWDEYRSRDYYGTQVESRTDEDSAYFFQRYYTEYSIQERLLGPLGQKPSVVQWFGETHAGRFAAYERRWMREGLNLVVEDPRKLARHYRQFDSWSSMPGKGVCALVIDK